MHIGTDSRSGIYFQGGLWIPKASGQNSPMLEKLTIKEVNFGERFLVGGPHSEKLKADSDSGWDGKKEKTVPLFPLITGEKSVVLPHPSSEALGPGGIV